MKKKYVLVDASSLISLTSSCLDNALEFFHDNFDVHFYAPQSVEYEAVTRPLNLKVKIHQFSALRIQKMIDNGILEVVPENLEKETKKLMALGNSIYYARGHSLNLFHKGEIEALALANKLEITSLLMDERSTRIIVEDPEAFRDHLQKEFKTNILVNKKHLSQFLGALKHTDVIRTTELVYFGYTNGFFSKFGKLENAAAVAALYKLKYAGCAISFKELEEYEKLIQ